MVWAAFVEPKEPADARCVDERDATEIEQQRSVDVVELVELGAVAMSSSPQRANRPGARSKTVKVRSGGAIVTIRLLLGLLRERGGVRVAFGSAPRDLGEGGPEFRTNRRVWASRGGDVRPGSN